MSSQTQAKDGLYHRVLGFPQGIVAELLASPVFNCLKFGQHALRAAQDDRYGAITLPAGVTVTTDNLIEIAQGQPSKFVVRIPHDTKNDMVLVVVPEGVGRGFVRTVWLNEKNDRHATLKRHLYRRP